MRLKKKTLTNDIFKEFHITSDEYEALEKDFDKLCYHIAHDLKKKNSNNNFIDDVEDVTQDLRCYLIYAGSYYKRQVYIERCFACLEGVLSNELMYLIYKELSLLWTHRSESKKVGQKFGRYHEKLLVKLVKKYIPKAKRPNPQEKLVIDAKCSNYCKSIVWNRQKALGKKITKEKNIRTGQVSLSEHSHLVGHNSNLFCFS